MILTNVFNKLELFRSNSCKNVISVDSLATFVEKNFNFRQTYKQSQAQVTKSLNRTMMICLSDVQQINRHLE